MSIILVLICSILLASGGAAPVAAQEASDDGAGPTAAGDVSAESTGEAEADAEPPSPEAVVAREKFDKILAQYQQLEQEIAKLEEARASARGTEGEALDKQILEKRAAADETIRELAAAGADVYEADPGAFPRVNATVMAIAQFYLRGDRRGDGGDQYEKALTVIEELLDAGAGEQWSDLYLWGATAACCTNQMEKAEQYFEEADKAGLLGETPPVRDLRDPRHGLWEQAKLFHGSFDALRESWEEEQEIRAKEAEADDLPRMALHTTQGKVVVELFENEAPQATANFLSLVKKGFYDGVSFHRVLPGFMAQGGDPTGTGSGGPGYSIRCECYKPDARDHFRGSLSMAHAGRDTGGSQFFLTFVPTSFLDGRHTVFGRVIEGMDHAAALKRRDPQSASPPKPDKIVRAEVIRDRGHEYEFEKLPER